MSSTTSAGPKRVVNKTVTKILANQKSVAQEKTPAAAGKLRKKPQPQPKAPAPAPALALALTVLDKSLFVTIGRYIHKS